MRTAYAFALVASLFMMTGCAALKGPSCGDRWGGFCDEGGCDSGCGVDGGFTRPLFGFRGVGGCASGNCGGETATNFSDYNYDCGPMCGAYLQDGQTSGGCGCDSCEVAPSYIAGQFGSWFGQNRPRPVANSFGMMKAGVSGGWSSMTGRFGCGSDAGCDAGGSAGIGIGPCRGLGGMVGCGGCGDCGGSAVGTNHSACSTGDCNGGMAGGGNCGPDGCGAIGRGGSLAGAIKNALWRTNGSPHPYGGETPHTASAANGAGFGGAAAPSYQYPYYTTRGPRDFLMMNPPSIGR